MSRLKKDLAALDRLRRELNPEQIGFGFGEKVSQSKKPRAAKPRPAPAPRKPVPIPVLPAGVSLRDWSPDQTAALAAITSELKKAGVDFELRPPRGSGSGGQVRISTGDVFAIPSDGRMILHTEFSPYVGEKERAAGKAFKRARAVLKKVSRGR